jgi:hypothetical protein
MLTFVEGAATITQSPLLAGFVFGTLLQALMQTPDVDLCEGT